MLFGRTIAYHSYSRSHCHHVKIGIKNGTSDTMTSFVHCVRITYTPSTMELLQTLYAPDSVMYFLESLQH